MLTDQERAAAEAAVLQRVAAVLTELRWGSVIVTVRDGVPVQIERREVERLISFRSTRGQHEGRPQP